jgi:hypothetical protein
MRDLDRATRATVRRLWADVSYLASPELDGRAPGTDGHELAAEHIEAQMEELRLGPLFDAAFGQSIQGLKGDSGRNLCGELPGKTERRILIGAHYDHIQGCPGADDNAAAVAIALEVARRLQPWSGQAHVVFAFFDQEEPPYFRTPTMGSSQFVQDCPFPLDTLDCAIVMDLCGHTVPYGQCLEALFAMGAENQQYLADAVLAVSTEQLPVLPVPHEIAPDLSDHWAFGERRAPFLFLTCGRWEHYHQPTDRLEVLDLPKMAGIADVVESLVRRLDSHTPYSSALQAPTTDFDNIAAESFRRLTGLDLPPDLATLIVAARAWLGQVGG